MKVSKLNPIFLRRFGCLVCGIRSKTPSRCCVLIQACLVLHNIGTTRRDYIEYTPGRDVGVVDHGEIFPEKLATKAGKKLRNYYARKYFA